ncbi:putative toxin-antitoxin system toxin component, PIN family [Pedobacter sp. MC2016-14]|uniref:putative toxin-antitoxin system toxin component, PIN family n=1 Tax=Pedobacter sp. MC2016-14 TaxID=2897327 RepID=UPI001E2A7591|nr:putative toxin-antitoxin system toxin component, PIN family [Pedobacter sp. MC2016-14]MCD0489258.1 putative toxin-antitoxin system toxin component, PIN family [Pedobacter sp. MC2016-14]
MISNYVLDCNTIISAHILPNSVSSKAFEKAFQKGTILCTEEILNEFSVAYLRPKFEKYIPAKRRVLDIRNFKNRVKIITVDKKVKICRDEADDKYLALALFGNVSCIITGDHDLRVLNPFRGILILSPGEFLITFDNSLNLNEPLVIYEKQ